MWSVVLEMMLKMVRMVMLGFWGLGEGMQGENSLSPLQKGQNFGGPFMEEGVCSPGNLDFSLRSARGIGLGPAGEILV